MLQYVQDYDERYPVHNLGYTPPPFSATTIKWMDATYPYVKKRALYNCPSDPLTTTTNTANNPYVYYYNGRNSDNRLGSYSYNNAYYNDGNFGGLSTGTGAAGRNAAQIANPAEMIAVSESNLVRTEGHFYWHNARQPTPTTLPSGQGFLSNTNFGGPITTPVPNGLVERHLETLNVALC